nr:non-specific lipid-transfer protein A-like [Malus domestica]
MAKIIAILMLLLVAGSAMGDGDDRPKVPYCPIVLDNLTPCLPYVLENEAKPAKVCCNGVLDLSHSAGNKEGRQNICDCIKAEAILMNMPLDNFSKFSSLPKACGLLINLPPISNNTDCSTVD